MRPAGGFDSVRTLAGSRSLRKAATLNMPTTMLQITKKSQAASEKRESLSMMDDPLQARGGLRMRLAPALTCFRTERRNSSDWLLLGRSRSLFVHALLHAGFMISFHLLELSLLVVGEQLVKLVMDLGLLNGDLSLNLGLLRC